MDNYLYLLIAVTYLIFLIWLIKNSAIRNIFTWTSFSLLVVLALIYDNLVLSLGKMIGEGNLLYNLHLVSNWLHVILTPTLVIFCFAALRQAGVTWAQKTYFLLIGICLSIGLSIWEGINTLSNIKLKPKIEYGVLSYTNANPTSHIFGMIMIVMLVILLTSIFLWVYCKFNFFFWGLIIMTLIMAIESWIPSNAFTNISELLLLVTILITKHKLDIGQVYKSEY